MAHLLYSINENKPDVNGEIELIEPQTMLSECAPNSTPTGSTFNYSVGDYYRWDGTQSNINSTYITDHADGTYTVSAGTYLIDASVSFQKSYSTNSKSNWRWYDQTGAAYYGAAAAAVVNNLYTDDIGPSQITQIITFTSSVRIGFRCTWIGSGVFQNATQDTESNAYLIITRLH